MSAEPKARRAANFSTTITCVAHAFLRLGVCVMITAVPQRTETERQREATAGMCGCIEEHVNCEAIPLV